MEEFFSRGAAYVTLVVEAGAALIIFFGAIEALVSTAVSLFNRDQPIATRKHIWVRFAMWLLLALEFELAADIIRSAIAPSWSDIGQLGAIAAIRTFLNFFLERDIDKATAAGS
jgi:uncharacterized membrane protein